MGHFITGLSSFMDGDFQASMDACNKAVQTAADPFYSQFPRFLLGSGFTQNGQFLKAEEALQEVASYSRGFGCELLGTPTHALLGLVSIAKGQMAQGLKMIEETLYQTKNRSSQDPLNYPIKLTNKLAHLNSLSAIGDYPPTNQAVEYKKEVVGEIDRELMKLKTIFNEAIPRYNELVKNARLDAVLID